MYSKRYTILHGTRKKKIEGVKADKLFSYNPWSSAIPSTSPDFTHDLRGYEIYMGTSCTKGELFVMVALSLGLGIPF